MDKLRPRVSKVNGALRVDMATLKTLGQTLNTRPALDLGSAPASRYRLSKSSLLDHKLIGLR